MTNIGRCALLVAALALAGGCGRLGIFEDVGADPHPPTVQITGIAFQPPKPVPVTTGTSAVEPPPTMGRPARVGKVITFNSGGFSVRRGEKFLLNLSYSDRGADLLTFEMRDLNGKGSWAQGPKAATEGGSDVPLYFPGITGTVTFEGIDLGADQLGEHHLQLWAQDSHESRSEKVEFIVNYIL